MNTDLNSRVECAPHAIRGNPRRSCILHGFSKRPSGILHAKVQSLEALIVREDRAIHDERHHGQVMTANTGFQPVKRS